MTRLALAMVALSLLTGCHANTGALYPGDTPLPQLLRATCGEQGAVCVAAEDARLAGQAADVFWGQFKGRSFDFAGLDVRAGVIYYERSRCLEDLDVCGFVLLHEVGHLREGTDQTEADCYAARFATPEQLDAGAALLATFEQPKRLAAFVECSQ